MAWEGGPSAVTVPRQVWAARQSGCRCAEGLGPQHRRPLRDQRPQPEEAQLSVAFLGGELRGTV